jgi:hypothetical protein
VNGKIIFREEAGGGGGSMEWINLASDKEQW